jgi:hypothetical protein
LAEGGRGRCGEHAPATAKQRAEHGFNIGGRIAVELNEREPVDALLLTRRRGGEEAFEHGRVQRERALVDLQRR